MTTDRYQDRFTESTYDNGAPCIIGLFDKKLIEESSIQIFDGLLSRLINIGQAYDLHIIPLFDIYNDTFFNGQQCESLVVELEFIERLTNDELLHGQIKKIKELATKCSSANGKLKLLVGGN